MNLGMNPGVSLNGEPIDLIRPGMEVVTASGNYVTIGPNLEIQLQAAGGGGITGVQGGNGGACAIKRIIGLPTGTTLEVVIGSAGVANSGAPGGSSTCAIPGYQKLVANGGIADRTLATAQGGDLNIPGGPAGYLVGGEGGYGGASALGFGGWPSQPSAGYGAGGATGMPGQPGVMIVRYF